MKRFILPLLVLLFVGSLFAVESAPSEVVGYVKYDCVTGLNLVALPMDQGYMLASEVGDAYDGLVDAVSYWDASTQNWFTAVYYDFLEMWDPDFSVAPGNVLMINALSPFSMYSIGDMPETEAQYAFVSGLNTLMVPLNQSSFTLASQLGEDIGVVDAVSYWDASTQNWFTAVYYDFLEMWDPDFGVSIAMPLMANVISGTTWPSRSGSMSSTLRSQQN